MNVLIHNHSGKVLTDEGLFTAQVAAREAAALGTHVDVEVGTMRDGLLACNVSPSGLLTQGSAANKIREQNSASLRTSRATISAQSIKDQQMAVIKDRAKLVDSTEADLRETYAAMTGESAPAEWSVEILRGKTSMAVLSNIDAAGHLGVARGGKPDALTHEELEARRRTRGAAAAGTGPHGSSGRNSRSEHEGHSSEIETMATAKKSTKASSATKAPKATKAAAPEAAAAGAATEAKAGRPKAPVTVSATGNGTTNVRPTSFRGQVLAAITAKKKISTTELDAQFGKPTLGEVRVLEKLGHVAIAA